MRIALLNPNSNAATTEAMASVARRAAGDAFEVVAVTAPTGPKLITTVAALAEAARVVTGLADMLAAYDGVIVAAFGDPGREQLADALNAPVVGIAEAAMEAAHAQSDGQFAIVTVTPRLSEPIRDVAAGYGHLAALTSVRHTSGDPHALIADKPRLLAALGALIDEAVCTDNARAVVIGGGPLADAAYDLAATSPVPLIQPIPAAVATMRRRLTSLEKN